MTMLLTEEARAAGPALDTRYLEVADAIGSRLVRDAVWSGGRCNWLVWTKEPHAGAFHSVLRAAPADLYLGAGGIALFLAHLSTVTHDRGQREAALGAALRVHNALREGAPGGTGFYSGDGGSAWALTRIGLALEEERWVRAGLDALAAVAARAEGAAQLDLLAGHAGLVLALVDCAGRFGEPALLEDARRLAGIIAGAARPSAEGVSWATGAGETRDLLGLSHGTTGIALALLELDRVSPDARWADTAREALRYERAHFDAGQRNWPDFRALPGVPAGTPGFPVAWCHGATGIGIARLRMLDLLPGDPRILPEVDVALARAITALNTPLTPLSDFTLCHGAAGNGELLLLVAQRFGHAEALAAARRVGDAGYQAFHAPRLPWGCGIPDSGETPSLLTGTAGIGMHYLRLYDPAAMPSILLPHVTYAARDA